MHIENPSLLVAAIALIVVGFWLTRWGMRLNADQAIKDATIDEAVKTLEGREKAVAAGKRKVAGYSARNSASQVIGISGFLMLMAGLLAAAFAIFGT